MDHRVALPNPSDPFLVSHGMPMPEEFPSMMGFGDYTAFPAARSLLRAGSQVCLGGRAFDLLMLLLAARGRVVSKQAIMTHVWPTTTVDESNLRFQMAVLRKALGKDRGLIKTIPGRGYLFAADVKTGLDGNVAEAPARVPVMDDTDGQRAICDALCALLVTLERYSSAAASIESLLSVTIAQRKHA